VRGDLCIHNIHLGSGNILMSPGDRYLCIVGDSRPSARGDTIYLPFEGDRMLSMILSKAILLAADAKITDVTILRQIRANGWVGRSPQELASLCANLQRSEDQ